MKTTRNTLVTEKWKLFKQTLDHVVLNPAP